MRVAMLAPENSPSWGGVGSYIYNLVKHLPSNVEVHIITLDRDVEDTYEKLFAGDERIHIHKILSVSSNEIFFTNLRFQVAVFRKLKKLHNLYHFDLIHSHSGHLPHFFSQFQNIAPTIVTPHGETKGAAKVWKEARNRNITESLSLFLSPIIEFGTKVSLKRADRLLPVSRFVLEQINKEYGLDIDYKARVVYNGVDTNFFIPQDKVMPQRPVITFVGRFYAIKGFDVFVDATAILMRRGYSVKLLLVGRGDTKQVGKLLLPLPKDSYTLVGRVKYHDMPEIYRQSDIVVTPSRYEACPGVIMEAMSCGKIVIASAVGGITEIIDDGYNGLLFQSENVEELAGKIAAVIDKQVDIEKMRRNTRKTVVNKFDWRVMAKEVYEEYSKMIGDGWQNANSDNN